MDVLVKALPFNFIFFVIFIIAFKIDAIPRERSTWRLNKLVVTGLCKVQTGWRMADDKMRIEKCG